MRAAPAVSCAMCTKSARTSIQGSGGNPTFPAQWLYGLLRALPGERLFCLRRCAGLTTQLDASTEASGPHVFAVRVSAVRRRHLHVHRIPSRAYDDRETPLVSGRDQIDIWLIWVWCQMKFLTIRNLFGRAIRIEPRRLCARRGPVRLQSALFSVSP